MGQEFVIIANPVAGTQKAPYLAVEILNRLKKQGAKARIILSQKPKEATKIAAQLESPENILVACGGDGTIQEIISGIRNQQTTVGIIPGGRCNDFARAIGISKTFSPDRLAEILIAGKTRAFDCGEVNGKKFLTVATLGFDSEVSRFVETRKLLLKGTGAYLYGVIRALLKYNPIEIKLKTDDFEYKGKILLCATANTPFYGGAMKIAPVAKPDDGYLNLCIVNEVSKLTVIRMLLRVFKGTHITHPAVRLVKTRTVQVVTETKNWICADGESLTQTPCAISIKPASLKVICP
ncbi:MAG: diacylglycerol/lipid kinase family protein [Verrucomicrobiia bacterium]|jgi:YegS/Rv2252/BmrU family lipid kinase